MVMFYDAGETRLPDDSRVAAADPLSPMSPFVLAYQQIVYYGRVPDPAVCAVAAAYAAIAFVGGFALFTRLQHEFVEQI